MTTFYLKRTLQAWQVYICNQKASLYLSNTIPPQSLQGCPVLRKKFDLKQQLQNDEVYVDDLNQSYSQMTMLKSNKSACSWDKMACPGRIKAHFNLDHI